MARIEGRIRPRRRRLPRLDATVAADDSAWPAQLERSSTLATAQGQFRSEYGCSRNATFDNVMGLQTELYRRDPDMVVLLQGHHGLYYALVGSPPGDPDTPVRGRRCQGGGCGSLVTRCSMASWKVPVAHSQPGGAQGTDVSPVEIQHVPTGRWRTRPHDSPGPDLVRADCPPRRGARRPGRTGLRFRHAWGTAQLERGRRLEERLAGVPTKVIFRDMWSTGE